jgi:pyridoxamine 5'-phosphate oxidase
MSEGLERAQLASDPLDQFETWFKQANSAGIADANACSIATCGTDGMPSARTVLLKLFDASGFAFFTNYNSHKAQQLEQNSHASLLFPWLQLNRQVRIEGHCEKLSRAESFKYFTSRPRGSQIGAWCSDQSEVIESRRFLEQKYQEVDARFESEDIPLPPFWGGYRLVPVMIEFWQGRENRLHDRFQFRLEDGAWRVQRLAP